MATESTPNYPRRQSSWGTDMAELWRNIPHTQVFVILLGAWAALFHFYGNSTLGYVDTPSLFGWWKWTQSQTAEDSHTLFIPLVVIFLLWHRRADFAAIRTRIWWPALAVFFVGTALHILGYAIQQARLSLIAFFVGVYGIGGVLWGVGWMRKVLVPFSMFSLCVPLGNAVEAVTFPLRLVATQITATICKWFLGVDVIQRGNQLFDAAGNYQYEVAAACSGIQSLTAVMAIALIYSYLNFRTLLPCGLMLLTGIPLAIVANVTRLVMIIIAAEAYGQAAGNYVHASGFLSLLPYIPAIGGILLFGSLLRRVFRRDLHPDQVEPAKPAEDRA